MTRAVRLRIAGRVQGVGYRAWLAGEALRAGLHGWVRNCRDGSVEAVLSGPEATVEDVTARCRQGPALARVTAVDATPAPLPIAPGFEVRPTA